jgi:GNAT superfamily N-acetyltransferase
MAPSSELTYSIAQATDHRTVVNLLGELVDELGPTAQVGRVKDLLDADIATALATANVRIFLAMLEGEAIGLSRGDILTQDPIFRLREDQRCGYIDQMFVRPAYRDRGVGAKLLALCEQWFRDQGLGHCILHAAPKAVRFYARIGYQPNREMFKRL